jgi:hypothetical protein
LRVKHSIVPIIRCLIRVHQRRRHHWACHLHVMFWMQYVICVVVIQQTTMDAYVVCISNWIHWLGIWREILWLGLQSRRSFFLHTWLHGLINLVACVLSDMLSLKLAHWAFWKIVLGLSIAHSPFTLLRRR